MKQIASDYTYNKTTGVITLTGVDIDRDQLLLIVNTTRNVTYYNFADSATTLQAFTKGSNTSITLASSVVSASSAHTNADALTIYYDDQANAIGQQSDDGDTSIKFVPIGWALTDSGTQLDQWKAVTQNSPLPISGTVTSLAGGETPTSGTVTLTNDTRWELNTEGFGTIAFEIVSTGVTWSNGGVVAQAYNGTAPANADLFAPAGIRYRHANDTGAVPTNALNNIYWNLNIGPFSGNSFGTNLMRIDGSNSGSLALPATGTRYFLFDLTTSRFALRPFFTAGSVTVKYRLYKEKHPFFSARNIIATGDGTAGAVRVEGNVGVSGYVSMDGGYLESIGGIDSTVTANLAPQAKGPIIQIDSTIPNDPKYVAIVGGFDTAAVECRALKLGSSGGIIVQELPTVNTYPHQGATVTNTNFTSTTSATLASSVAGREVLTVFNEGPATLFINAGTSASTTSYQVRLLAGDYWEAPAGQQSLQHSGIFSSAGSTARVTQIS